MVNLQFLSYKVTRENNQEIFEEYEAYLMLGALFGKRVKILNTKLVQKHGDDGE